MSYLTSWTSEGYIGLTFFLSQADSCSGMALRGYHPVGSFYLSTIFSLIWCLGTGLSANPWKRGLLYSVLTSSPSSFKAYYLIF